MADVDVRYREPATGVDFAFDSVTTGAGPALMQRIKVMQGTAGSNDPVDFATEATLGDVLTELQAQATLAETQPVSLASVPTHAVTGPLTNSELRDVAVPVSGPLTDTQLRLTAVPVSLASVPSHAVTGPVTNAELRASAVPVSGTFFQATQPVSGPLTDAALRASAVPVSAPHLSNQTGTWGYSAGTSGTVTLTGGKRVLLITAIAQQAAASLTINGGATISLPYGSTDKVSSAITIEPKGNLTDPVIVLTGTASYFIEFTT